MGTHCLDNNTQALDPDHYLITAILLLERAKGVDCSVAGLIRSPLLSSNTQTLDYSGARAQTQSSERTVRHSVELDAEVLKSIQ